MYQFRTFIHWCIDARKKEDFISHLLQEFPGNIIDEPNSLEQTPLCYVVSNLFYRKALGYKAVSEIEEAKLKAELDEYCLKVTKFLVSKGADVNARSPRRNYTPLSSSYVLPVMKYLLAKNAKIYNITYKESTGLIHDLISKIQLHGVCSHPLVMINVSLMAEKNDEEVMKKFKEKMDWYINELGIDVDERSEQGRTGLHYCCLPRESYYQTREKMSYNTQHIIQCLVEEFSADIDAQDKLGYTALMYAVKYEMFQQTAMLMKLGADSYIESYDGMTATSLAHGCSEKTELFLSTLRKSGATYGEKNNHIAQCQAKISQVYRLLRKQENMMAPD